MGRKIRVAILFGGKSAEHEVSLQSARNIVEALDKKKYEPVLIGIGKSGAWLPPVASQQYLALADARRKQPAPGSKSVALIPASAGSLTGDAGGQKIDVVFPILHGPFGEDGTVQGLLRLADVPFVGAGVLGSAVGMDKDVMKRLLRDAGIPVAPFLVAGSEEPVSFVLAKKKLGLPLFIKPANLGSSVGVNKVRNAAEFKKAVAEAFRYDSKIIIEQFIKGREIECAVLGNEKPIASVPGELVLKSDFYSYDAKYLDADAMTPEIPAKLPKAVTEKIRALAVKAFKVLSCEGLGRVDFFLADKGTIYVNEINTLPGFTNISMYPKLWEASGLSYSTLIDRLLQLAIQRHEKQKRLKTSQ